MANFTTGVINLAVANTFDNVIMGAGNTMSFSGNGKGGPDGGPIKVTGNFTIGAGATVTLRNGSNLTPGSVLVLGVTRNLNAQAVVPGVGGAGGSSGGIGALHGGGGGGGGSEINGSDGANGYGSQGSPNPDVGGSGGAYPGSNGVGGSTGLAVTAGRVYNVGGGGGGGGGGESGASTENVSFYVLGDVSITGGTLNANGENAASNGGAGGQGGAGGGALGGGGGGGGGGGEGGGGGHAGNLYIFHIGAAAEAFAVQNQTGGTKTNGGAGGAAGSGNGGGPDPTAGVAGTNGVAGNNGIVELIDVDTVPTVTTEDVTNVFASQALLNGTIVSGGGHDITERGFCVAEDADPDVDDTKIVVAGVTTPYSYSLTGLDANTTYHVRSFATNEIGTSYGADVEFTTIKSFVPKAIVTIGVI